MVLFRLFVALEYSRSKQLIWRDGVCVPTCLTILKFPPQTYTIVLPSCMFAAEIFVGQSPTAIGTSKLSMEILKCSQRLPNPDPNLQMAADIRSAHSLVRRLEAWTIVRKRAMLNMTYFAISFFFISILGLPETDHLQYTVRFLMASAQWCGAEYCSKED